MPGQDGTGPDSEGPMTGRRLGSCGGKKARGYGRGRKFLIRREEPDTREDSGFDE